MCFYFQERINGQIVTTFGRYNWNKKQKKNKAGIKTGDRIDGFYLRSERKGDIVGREIYMKVT